MYTSIRRLLNITLFLFFFIKFYLFFHRCRYKEKNCKWSVNKPSLILYYQIPDFNENHSDVRNFVLEPWDQSLYWNLGINLCIGTLGSIFVLEPWDPSLYWNLGINLCIGTLGLIFVLEPWDQSLISIPWCLNPSRVNKKLDHTFTGNG